MKRTVKEIKAMLETLPDNMNVEFKPITSAFLGTSNPLRFDDIGFYKDLNFALPSELGAELTIYLTEDRQIRV